ncbi:MAG: hypothetical protein LKF88_01755 [Microbacteriaceae bacterium]|jgi:hypothetical protein|nr:hypothetical protein [Microbacteriaceae bacterium]MCI1207625.1 hypothetical protein [Microbacteriaceae bacterium]
MPHFSNFWSTLRPSRRFLSLFWFPLFFVAAFSCMFVINVGHARPNGVQVGVIGTPTAVRQATGAIDRAERGVQFHPVADETAARARIARNELAGVLDVSTPAEPRFLMAMAASGSRALYLQSLFGRALGTPVQAVDVVPTAPGDFTGVGLFFCSLPLQVLGLITAAILGLAQVTSWRQKFFWIALYGAFGAGFTYVLCTSLQVIPNMPVLALLGFLLTQTIAWIAVGAAAFLKHFFLPVIMPFIVIFEIPISGGPMSADMMPGFSQVLHAALPFSRYLDAARSIAYFHGAGAWSALGVLLIWTAIGLGLMLAGRWWTRRGASSEPPAAAGQVDAGVAIEAGSASADI